MGADPYREGQPGDRVLPKWWRRADKLLAAAPLLIWFVVLGPILKGFVLTYERDGREIVGFLLLALTAVTSAVLGLWCRSLRKRWAERLVRPLDAGRRAAVDSNHE
jgi:hypothetical protein